MADRRPGSIWPLKLLIVLTAIAALVMPIAALASSPNPAVGLLSAATYFFSLFGAAVVLAALADIVELLHDIRRRLPSQTTARQ